MLKVVKRKGKKVKMPNLSKYKDISEFVMRFA
jgi:hypothetical protein